MSTDTYKDILIGFSFILAEVFVFQHLSFFGATPDPLLIFVLWITMKYDRVKLILIVAGLSFFQDALFDYWGLNMFAKTLLCFMAFNFLNRRKENRLLIWQIFLVIFIGCYFTQPYILRFGEFRRYLFCKLFSYNFIFLNSLYTALLGSILFIFKGN